MLSFTSIIILLSLLFFTPTISPLPLLASSSSFTVPSFPVQPDTQPCHLDLSDELFGGVSDACGRSSNLDRSRCCPVLAAWLFAAHARTALEVSPAPVSGGDLPMMPDDSQKCVESLQESLRNRSIRIPQANASCDAVTCFCGIRLHRISSLSCPAAFNVSGCAGGRNHNAAPTAAVLNLEKNCRNSSYAGCTKCLAALQKLKGNKEENKDNDERARKMFNRDCQLIGLTWLLGRNKTAYIPTVSAVLRAIMYSAHPHESKCSPDQENMPLAVDSLQFDDANASSRPLRSFPIIALLVVALTIIFLSV